MTAPTPIVAARDLVLTRGGRAVLRVAQLCVAAGETWVLVGPNGAGKSTLLRALALLQPPARGALELFGAPAPQPPPLALRRRVVSTFQETLLLDDTVLANVALPRRLRGEPRAVAEASAREALRLFAAEALAPRRARRISGGEARRVALARAFAAGAELILLDEPFAALDPPSRESLASDLKRALRATGATCVAVSHDRAEALALSDHMGVLLGGELVQAGPTDEVFRAPATEEVARFVGVENLFPVQIGERRADAWQLFANGVELTCAPRSVTGPSALACVRAEEVLLAVGETGALSARNAIACTVAAVEPTAHGVRVRLQGPLPLVAALTRASVAELDLAPGRSVRALFKAGAIHLV